MNESRNGRVRFEGRACDVVLACLYAGDYYDIWLQDVATQKYTDVCTVTDRDLPVRDHERLVREAYVGLLTEAGYATPTGEIVESEKYGRLYCCEVPEREPVNFLQPFLDEKESQVECGDRECDRGDDIEL